MAQVLPRFFRQQEAEVDARRLAARLLESGEMAPLVEGARVLSLIGDERQLRGIPAIGRGVGGAMMGTRPGDDLLW